MKIVVVEMKAVEQTCWASLAQVDRITASAVVAFEAAAAATAGSNSRCCNRCCCSRMMKMEGSVDVAAGIDGEVVLDVVVVVEMLEVEAAADDEDAVHPRSKPPTARQSCGKRRAGTAVAGAAVTAQLPWIGFVVDSVVAKYCDHSASAEPAADQAAVAAFACPNC